ncbi:MAG TPA: hypothetical protein VN712_05600, partial [Dermatophilaceae bacterium]|nr:hypothetical protein [Dermatophilaceae bacterium]
GYFGPACATAQADINAYNNSAGTPVMATGWVLFGVGVVGTVACAMVDWFPKRNATTGAATGPKPELAILPLVSPTVHGLGVVGTF